MGKIYLNGIDYSSSAIAGVTGVKGNSESSYRTGNVNLTAANIGALSTSGDSKNNTVTFTSADATNPTAWTDVAALATGEKHSSLFNKVSTMFKNIRYLYKILGSTDISGIGNGTVTGAVSALNTDLGNRFAPNNNNHPWGQWSNQNIASGSWTANVGKIAEGNNSGAYNVNITKSGIYLVIATALFSVNASGIRGIRLIMNEATHQPEELYPASANTTTVRTVRSLQLNVGDTLRIGLYQNSGVALSATYISLNSFRLLD